MNNVYKTIWIIYILLGLFLGIISANGNKLPNGTELPKGIWGVYSIGIPILFLIRKY